MTDTPPEIAAMVRLGEEEMLGTLARRDPLRQAGVGWVMLEMGRWGAESIMLIERSCLGLDYYPIHSDLHEDGPVYIRYHGSAGQPTETKISLVAVLHL